MNIKRCNTRHILLGGDFNAKSVYWGCPTTDSRGEYVESWAANSGLTLLNIGRTPTCIRHQGDSIVDLTWSTPGFARCVASWKVDKDILTLSDHRYLVIELKGSLNIERRDCNAPRVSTRVLYPKWSHKDIDMDLLVETIEWECSNWITPEDGHEAATKLKDLMTAASDLATKRVRKPRKKTQAHWWSSSLEEKRRECIASRRRWTKAKRRNNWTDVILYRVEYKRKRKALNQAIFKAKEEAWQSLLRELDSEPWGMAYKVVMNKLRTATPALTEVLEPGTLEELIHSLFPTDTDKRRVAFLEIPDWNEEWDVTPAEVHHVLIKRKSSNAAPGPDSISNKIWKLIPNSLVELIAKILTGCLRTGVFPDVWKAAKLVLIPKDPSNMDDIPKARPICLLDEIGKSFERIILRRIESWMLDKEGILSQNQFGFRRNRSTTDALMMVTNLIEEEISTGGVAIAVSIDIKNAFNSLPWTQIRSTLISRKFPRYLKRILHAYLSKRTVEYVIQDGS